MLGEESSLIAEPIQLGGLSLLRTVCGIPRGHEIAAITKVGRMRARRCNGTKGTALGTLHPVENYFLSSHGGIFP